MNFSYFNTVDAINMYDGNYTGALIGLFSTSNGMASQDYADFDFVNIKALCE